MYSTTTDIRRTLLEGKMESRLAFGSPSYPSPLDRVRSHKKDRGLQMGLSAFAEESFELNQSYPKVSRPKLNEPELPAPKTKIGNRAVKSECEISRFCRIIENILNIKIEVL